MNAMRLSAAALLLLLSGAISTSAVAASPEPPPGAASCSGCHTVSIRTKTDVPRIHGRSAAEIIAAMAAFRTGARASTVMDRIAKGFTEDEVVQIATWLATQKEERNAEQHRR
jgi:sulfide dehydrogenase cytochrome subunit